MTENALNTFQQVRHPILPVATADERALNSPMTLEARPLTPKRPVNYHKTAGRFVKR